MAEPERKCSTCKFYEPAPIWRKGWCRNPLLYAPQQSHLVAEDDLDCSRGLSDYWEAADGTGPNASVNLALSGGDPYGRSPGRGERGNAEPLANPWGGSPQPYGGGQNAPMPDDDGYAPHESAPPLPPTGPRYAGAVGGDEEIRNPWDTSQPGYGVPPAQPESAPNYGHDYGYGAGQQEPNPWQSPPAAGGYGQEQQGYGQGGYGQGGYEQEQQGYPPSGYGPGGYPAYDQGGYDDRGGYQQPPNAPPIAAGATGSGPRRVVPTPAATGKERSLSYYTEERYWTDYAKLIVPVVILIVILGAAWFVGTGKLRGGSSSATTAPNSTSVVGSAAASPRIGGTPAPGGSVRPGTTSASGVVTSSGVVPITTQATLPAGTPGTGTPVANTGTTTGTGQNPLPIQKYKVTNTGGAGVNLRDKPDVKTGKIVTNVAEGTEVQATGSAVDDGQGGTWTPVQVGNYKGFIRNDFLTAITA
ncbi:MAG: hypothetical protein ACYDAR_15210 [Thermomicrobiales bacterium]